MVKQIFESGFKAPDDVWALELSEKSLLISEMFYDTIQGEGVYTGYPALFMRLGGCTLNCNFCDSKEVWQNTQAVLFETIFEEFEKKNIIQRFEVGHHFIITGGSPLRQQNKLIDFLEAFEERYDFLPFIEIENECVIIPRPALLEKVSHWNNSPKLINSGNNPKLSYRQRALTIFKQLKENSYSWKFVISEEKDWKEIYNNYIEPGYIEKKDIILMPCGADRKELSETREMTVNLAIENGVRFCDRLHVTIWDRKTGV